MTQTLFRLSTVLANDDDCFIVRAICSEFQVLTYTTNSIWLGWIFYFISEMRSMLEHLPYKYLTSSFL